MESTCGLLFRHEVPAYLANFWKNWEPFNEVKAWHWAVRWAPPPIESQRARSAARGDGVRWKLHQSADGDAWENQHVEKTECQGWGETRQSRTYGSWHQLERRCQERVRKQATLSNLKLWYGNEEFENEIFRKRHLPLHVSLMWPTNFTVPVKVSYLRCP